MYSLDLAGQLLKELWKKKLRTALGIFGIFWGTASVVLLLALGSGYYSASVKSLSSIASGAMMFYPGETSLSYKGNPAGQAVMVKANQIITMGKKIPGIEAISATISGGSTELGYYAKKTNRSVSGVNWAYGDIWKINRKIKGRFISLYDVKRSLFVVVLGSKIKSDLFGSEDAVGKKVQLWGIPFTVIGAIKKDAGSSGGGWLSQKAFIPFTTMISIKGNINVSTFSVKPVDVSQIMPIKKAIRDYLGGLLHFNPADKMALNSPDLTQLMRYFTMFFLIIQVFLGFCGLLTLIVGGVSVANMMFLIVTERTREIGLRMALGAKSKNILFLVMLETFLVVGIGGLAGILFSELVVGLFDFISLPAWIGTPAIHAWTMFVTIFILFLVTFLSGIFPARSASRMQPVDALSF